MTTRAMALLTRRDDLAQVAWREGQPDGRPLLSADSLPEGSVLLRVEAVALTANTMTYGLLGEQFRYWDFFPTAEPGWGCLPAWGTGVVELSSMPDLPPGSRVSGLLPVASHCVLRPVRVTADSLRDGAQHRRELPGSYQHYDRLASASGNRAPSTDEALGVLLRPLFILGFLLADYLAELAQRRDISTVVLTSASSKTAQAVAQQLAASGIHIVGLTSDARVDAVVASGLYGSVLSYPQADLAAARAAGGDVVLVDLAGDASLRERLRTALAPRVDRTVLVGATHRPAAPALVPSPNEEVFFAPDRLRQRTADWGALDLRRRQDLAWADYLTATRQRIEMLHAHGPAAAELAYREVIEGRCPPEHGHLLHLSGGSPDDMRR